MIKKLTAMNKYPTAHLKCTMDSEWGILQILHRMLNRMNSRPVLEWVASHQDDQTTDITELSKGTQLNIKADKLVTQGLNQLHTKPRVPLDPSSEVLIHQDGRTITRDLKSTLRSNIHLPVLETYYRRKFGWSNTVYGYIDWDIFTPVCRHHKNKNLKWTNKFLI